MSVTSKLVRPVAIMRSRRRCGSVSRSTRAEFGIARTSAGLANRLMMSGVVALATLSGLSAAASSAQADFLPPPAGYLNLNLPSSSDPSAPCNLYTEPGATFFKTLQVTGTSFRWNSPVTVTLQSVSAYSDEWGDVLGYKPNGFYSASETWTTDGSGNLRQTSAPANQPFPEIRSSYYPYFYSNASELFQATASGLTRTGPLTRDAVSNLVDCGDYYPPGW